MDALGDHVSEHFCYICKKGPNADNFSKLNYDATLNELYKQELEDYEKTLRNKPKVKFTTKKIEESDEGA